MKKYQRLHESKEVANKHIAKIKERGGNVKQSVKDGKILVEYSFPNGRKIIGYHGTTDKGYGSYKYTYYTADYDYAKEYAESKGRVEKVEISYNKPFIIDAKYMGYGEIVLDNKIIGFYRELQPDVVDKLKKREYDIIIVNYKEKNKIAYEIIPFDKSQVKIIDRDAVS